MNPLISIITPCYNASPFITQTIESVLSQTYPYWEMLIVDDCSTDRSAEIIQTYVERDTRIRYLRIRRAVRRCQGILDFNKHRANISPSWIVTMLGFLIN